MEREKFEASWKDSFDGAEITPSDKVWTNIELDLEKESGGALKRRLFFYKMLAAASVVFAMAIAGAAVYFNLSTQHGPGPLAQQTPVTNDIAVNPSTPTEEGNRFSPEEQQPVQADANHEISTHDGSTPPQPLTRAGETSPAPVTPDVGSSQPIDVLQTETEKRAAPVGEELSPSAQPLAVAQDERRYSDGMTTLQERPLPPLSSPRRIELAIPAETETVDPVAAMLARLERQERALRGEDKNKKERGRMDENLWTSIGFAAGSFNSLQSSGGAAPAPASFSSSMALAAPILDNETKASGSSYSLGINVGTKLAERWVLQGGVNYLTQASEYTANNVLVTTTGYQQQRFRAVSTNELINANPKDLSNKIVYSAPYSVNNSMRYLSLPLQAGYLLVNNAFGLQLNAGVATDLFLQNTVSADSDQLEETSQSAGADSPYRTFNFSGLLGTEFSYRFGDHYRIALNPGLRYPLNTIYKSELGVNTSPLTFDVGLRFRYIFH